MPRPELFNRIDRVVPFAPLDAEAARRIVKKELSRLIARPGLAERSIFVRFTDAVVARIVEEGRDARYGARALKRYIDREIGQALTHAIVTDAAAEMRLMWVYAQPGPRWRSSQQAESSMGLDFLRVCRIALGLQVVARQLWHAIHVETRGAQPQPRTGELFALH